MKIIQFRLIRDDKIVGYEEHKDVGGICGMTIWQYAIGTESFNIRYFPEKMIFHDTREQYIGLTDEYGVKVYENDEVELLKSISYGARKGEKMQVVWNEKELCYKFLWGPHTYYHVTSRKSIKVIGRNQQ